MNHTTAFHGLLDALYRQRSSVVLYCVSALLGLSYAVWLFDVGFLLGTSEYWHTIVGDRATEMAGYYYYIQDQWRFPIFFTQNYGFPDGVNIIFTDSAPIIPLLVKSLRGLLPDDFNVFGPWLAACYILQGVGIASLVIALGHRSLAVVVTATLLALSLPAFLVRVQLVSLPAQFLLTFALALYFHLVRETRPGATLGWFSVLLFCSLLIHPYLFAMVFAVLVAGIAQRVLDQPDWWRAASAYSAGVAVALIATMLVTGYIGSGAERGAPSQLGTPDAAMDVLAPVLPEGSGLLPWGGPIVNFGADYYNYLGLGLLLLVAVNLVASHRSIISGARRHVVLSLLLAAFAVFALSTTIRVAGMEVVTFHIPGPARWLISQFRASARFFWPLTYMVLAGVVVLSAQRFRRPAGTLFLAVAAVLQLLDTAPVRATVTRYSESTDYDRNLLDRATWSYLLANHDGVQVFPSFPCRHWDEEELRNFDMSLVLLAAKANVRTNSLYISGNRARSTKDCTLERDSVIDLKPATRELYVFFSDHYSPSVVQRLFGDGDCRRFKQGYVCTRQWSALDHGRDLSAFTTPEGPRFYRLGSTVDFRAGGNSRNYLAGGWLAPEVAGSRLDGPNAYLELPLAEPVRTPVNVSFVTFPVHVGNQLPVEDVSVLLNGAAVGRVRVDTRRAESHSVSVPAVLASDRSVLTLELRATHIATEGRKRNRRLNLGVHSLTVTPDT